jgi:hypothetical protein
MHAVNVWNFMSSILTCGPFMHITLIWATGREICFNTSSMPLDGAPTTPLPVSRRQAVPEPEIITGLSSQATTSTQPTELFLQQLMAEMKYLRERVDTLPAGPVQTSPEVRNPVPKLFPLLRIWKSLIKQHCLIPRPLSLLNSRRLAPPCIRIFVRWSGNMLILRFAYRTRIFTSLYIQITSVIFDFTSKVEHTSSKLCLSDWSLLRWSFRQS